MLEAKVADTVGLCLAHNKVSFIGFLDERERGIAEKLVDAMGNSNYLFWGGWQEAERVMLGCFSRLSGAGCQCVSFDCHHRGISPAGFADPPRFFGSHAFPWH